MRKAFTLIEIMVVVAILAILISLAVPNILRSRVTADEGAAVANIKSIESSCQSYHINAQAYPNALSDLSSANPPYIDSVLGTGKKQGYEFIYATADADHFTVHANPLHSGLMRGRFFYVDESSAIRANKEAQAGPDDEIIP